MQGIVNPEWIVVAIKFTAATSVGASTKTLGLFGPPPQYLLSEWEIVLIKCGFPYTHKLKRINEMATVD